jgi:hypothetical protein
MGTAADTITSLRGTLGLRIPDLLKRILDLEAALEKAKETVR